MEPKGNVDHYDMFLNNPVFKDLIEVIEESAKEWREQAKSIPLKAENVPEMYHHLGMVEGIESVVKLLKEFRNPYRTYNDEATSEAKD